MPLLGVEIGLIADLDVGELECIGHYSIFGGIFKNFAMDLLPDQPNSSVFMFYFPEVLFLSNLWSCGL